MPGLIKIGHTTTSLVQRINELNTTGVPVAFDIAASFLVTDSQACEQGVHAALSEYRVNDQREFFRIPLKSAIEKGIQVIIPFLDVTGQAAPTAVGLSPQEQEVLEHIFHQKSQDTWPGLVARYLGIAQQKAHYILGELVAKGYLKEKSESYSLTHKGRKHVIENDLVIDELLKDQ